MIHELFCYLRPFDASAAIDFYKAAFGATEQFRLNEPETGRIGHVQLLFGTTIVMLSDAYPERGLPAQDPADPARFTIHIHVDNADEVVDAAIRAGATLTRPIADQFYGERSGTVLDPFGYTWLVGHTIENVEPEEMQRRYDQPGAD